MKNFSTVAELKLAKLTAGQNVSTKGYYTAGDGGGATYLIAAPQAADGFGDHTLANGNVALIQGEILSLEQYGAADNADSSSAIAAAFASGKELTASNNTFIIDSEVALQSNLKLTGKDTIFQPKSSIGQNNLFAGIGLDNIDISGCVFDMRNDIITPALSAEDKENAIHLTSCTNIEIHNNKFTRDLKRSIRLDGTALAENENIFIHDNDFSDGSQGGVQNRRYGRNIHVYNNVLTNSVDSSVGGISFEKPIDVSGTIGAWIYDNKVIQTNGDGGSIIVEYVDRQSEDVHIFRNEYSGQSASTGSNIKVGASVGVWVEDNYCNTSGAANITIEGCENYIVDGNHCENAQGSGIASIQDADTLRVPKKGKITNNTIKNCNKAGNTLGVPVTGGAANASFAIQVLGPAEQHDVSGNVFVDDGDTFNGLLINSTDYQIRNNDFTLLNGNRIAIDNHFATTSTNWEITGNLYARTQACGIATILSGTSSIVVNPDAIAEGTNATWNVTVRSSVLSASVAYWTAFPDITGQFRIATRSSAHSGTNVSANTDFNWSYDVSTVANGIFAKTS
jgi:hypothetical protein